MLYLQTVTQGQGNYREGKERSLGHPEEGRKVRLGGVRLGD